MRHSVAVSAFVLRKISLLDGHVAVTLFTRERGKVQVIARGLRNASSRRSAHTQSGNLITAQIWVADERMTLQSTVLVSAFTRLRMCEKKSSHLSFLLFCLDRLLPMGEPEEVVFDMLLTWHRAIVSDVPTPISEVTADFLLFMLQTLGHGFEGIPHFAILRETVETIAGERYVGNIE